MAGSGGRPDSPLIQDLLDHPEEFDFFQAVRLIEQVAAERRSPVPVRRIGGDDGPRGEPVRFSALPSLTFPAGDIAAVRVAAEGSAPPSEAPLPISMTVSFMGLTGPNGVLPQHYTSLLIERIHLRMKDNSLREFLDLFNHRSVSLFYRAWEKYRFPYAYERRMRDGSPDDDLFTACLYCLVGLGARGLRERFSFDDQVILFFGGLFAQRTRNAVALEQMLSSCFGHETRVSQFEGQWLYLPESAQSAMPGSRRRSGLNLCLGDNTVAGSRVWDVSSRIRISLGPLTWSEFRDLLPSGRRLERLAQLVRFYVGAELDFDIQLILRRAEVPACRLAADSASQPRLGWNTWMGTDSGCQADATDAVFRF